MAVSAGNVENLYFDDLELYALGTGYRYDPAGRLGRVVRPDGSVFRLEHDRFGNLARSAVGDDWGGALEPVRGSGWRP